MAKLYCDISKDYFFMTIYICENSMVVSIGFLRLVTAAYRQKVGIGNVLMGTECLNTKLPGSLCLRYYCTFGALFFLATPRNDTA